MSNRIIAGFVRSTPERLREIGEVYAPAMDARTLENCRRFFFGDQRRDPTENELRLLGGLVAAHGRSPRATLIHEMLTNDSELARTLADLVAKRSALEPSYSSPVSLADILPIAAEAIGTKQVSPLSCDRYPTLALAADMLRSELLDGDIKNGFAVGYPTSHDTLPLHEGDRIYAVLKSKNHAEDFEEKLSALASDAALLAASKRILLIDGNPILPLLSLGVGLDISLDTLYGEGDIDACRNELGLLIITSTENAADMLMKIIDRELRPCLAGNLHIAKKPTCLLGSHDGKLALSFEFLNSLFASRAYRAEVADAPADGLSASLSPCTAHETITAFRSDTVGENRFYAAIYGTLSALSACIARGADFADVRLAAKAPLTATPGVQAELGKCLAGLLGLYRAVTELSLGGFTVSLDDKADAVTVYAATPTGSAFPQSPQLSSNSKIYLLEPLYRGDMPDFGDLVKMYGYIGALRRDGILLSARAVTGDVIPALEEMSENGLIEYLRRESYEAKAGSILVEAKGNIQGLLLAKTCPPEPEEPKELGEMPGALMQDGVDEQIEE